MDEMDVENAIKIAIEENWPEFTDLGEAPALRCTTSFRDAGVMTKNQGLVIKLIDGSEFQVTIVRSK